MCYYCEDIHEMVTDRVIGTRTQPLKESGQPMEY